MSKEGINMSSLPGVGYVGWDITLFMLAVAAFSVNCYYLPQWFRVSAFLGALRALRIMGWLILSSRFGFVLFTQGDLMVSPQSIIALLFLSLGEILVLFQRGKVLKL